jgi:hypothetical protein
MSLIADAKKVLHEELDLRILETTIDIQATNTLAGNTRRGLGTEPTETEAGGEDRPPRQCRKRCK